MGGLAACLLAGQSGSDSSNLCKATNDDDDDDAAPRRAEKLQSTKTTTHVEMINVRQLSSDCFAASVAESV